MADTSYQIGSPLAATIWSKELMRAAIAQTFFNKFTGPNSTDLVQVKNELKGGGTKITYGLAGTLSSLGVQGDNTLDGNEEELNTSSDSVYIDQLRNAVRSKGKMSDQRVLFNVRDEAKIQLAKWIASTMDTSLANQLAGYTAQTDTRATGNNAAIAPSTTGTATRVIFSADNTTEGSLSATTTHAIKAVDIDRCVAIAKSQNPIISPIRIGSDDFYVMFLHPYAIRQLRADVGTSGSLFDIQKYAMSGGRYENNPIITGADFAYNNVLIHEWAYLPTIVSTPNSGSIANFRRGVFCGAQAAVCAYGKEDGSTWQWVEEQKDYGNKLGVSAGLIYGMKKSVFNSQDYATITVAGFASAS